MAIKILIGGSPCTYWSIAQTNNRETKAEGMGWELFKNYLIAKGKFKPDFFLYENNKSAAQAIKDQISEEFGVGVDPKVRFTYINSALVSAQNRQRFYVTNFGDIEQPEDRGILLKDILEGASTDRDKGRAVISSAGRTTTREYFDKQQGTMACEPVETEDRKINRLGGLYNQVTRWGIYGDNGLAPTLTASMGMGGGHIPMMVESVDTEEMTPPCGQRGQEKARTLTSGYANKSQRDLRKDIETNGFMGAQGVVEPIYIGEVPEHNGKYRNGKQASQQYRVYDTEGKGVSVTTSAITNVAEPVNVSFPYDTLVCKIKRLYDLHGAGSALHIVLDDENIEDSHIRWCLRESIPQVENIDERALCEDIANELLEMTEREREYLMEIVWRKNAEPIQVGALPRPNGEVSTSQAMRIYSQEGKSVTQSAGGGGLGGKTGLYAIPVNCATPVEWDENGIPTKAVSYADGKTYTVYEVKDGQITIKGKQYPIKLPDGYYIIRKLTVRECARLQTMPDDYCKAVSDSQAYKALGNGWTAEVIIHLLNHALKDVPRDEEIVVLSLYDGIATGRYCLDKMGFTNVTYHAYEIDKYPIMVAMDNYPDIIQHGDAFAVREDDWKPPQTRSEWLDELLGGEL